jgi:hypothetical protein
VRSSLATTASACREPDPRRGFEARKAAWHQHGLITLYPDEVQGWGEREMVKVAAVKLFGKRVSDGQG